MTTETGNRKTENSRAELACENCSMQEWNEEELEKEVRHQMRVMLKGAAEVVGEEELRLKVERSIREGKPLNVKFGMDPSAPDIHLGHAVALRKLKQMQDLGHRIKIIIGDFTGRIGDPTGKSKGRKALSDKQVMENAQTYLEQIFKILEKEKTEVYFNGEWLELLTLEEVLRLASTTTVARMLERDDFKKRFEGNVPIGLHEFFYPLMQAYDSVAIDADIELGGTDQTFNILMGRSLQKDMGKEPQAAIFMPILEGLDGVEKMSKSLGNYIGINEEANVMFKKVMEVPDALIIRYFELATDEMPEKIDLIKEELADGKNPRDVKLKLAEVITGLYHGQEEMEQAESFYHAAFSRKAIPEKIPELEIPMEKDTLLSILPILAAAGYGTGSSELRRLIAQGGVQKNGEKVLEVTVPIADGDVLKLGKKRFVRLRKTV
ncbi:MAG: tyrosine--tRNA ligase [Lachnospiraceae bacterium]